MFPTNWPITYVTRSPTFTPARICRHTVSVGFLRANSKAEQHLSRITGQQC